jgi:hypothetical protein
MSTVKTFLGFRTSAPKGVEPNHHQHAAPNERIESMLRELVDRTRRIETRVVVLMREHGIDPHGNPIDR